MLLGKIKEWLQMPSLLAVSYLILAARTDGSSSHSEKFDPGT